MSRMNADRSPQPAPRELVSGLFDDASLFPPGNSPMPLAVAAHGRQAAAWYHDLTGPFVCPETRLEELRAVLTAANVPEIDLALVVTGGAAAVGAATDAVASDPRLRLRAIEVSARRIQGSEPTTDSQSGHEPTSHEHTDHGHGAVEVAAALDAALLGGAAGYIEIPLGLLADPATADEVLSIVARTSRRWPQRWSPSSAGTSRSSAPPDCTTRSGTPLPTPGSSIMASLTCCSRSARQLPTPAETRSPACWRCVIRPRSPGRSGTWIRSQPPRSALCSPRSAPAAPMSLSPISSASG